MAHYKGAAVEATRAMHIMKRREKAIEELEMKKRKLEGDVKLSTIDNKFSTHHDSIESQLKSTTVGLVTLGEMKERQEIAVKEREKQLAQKDDPKIQSSILEANRSVGNKNFKASKALSFGYDEDSDDDEDDVDSDQKEKIEQKLPVKCQESELSSMIEDKKKEKSLEDANLGIDTDFLPDRDRELEEKRMREKLAEEWREKQQKLKEEVIEITFSYWDGSGHRRVVKMKKGNSIYQFLQACLETLRKDFPELRKVSADRLMYVKEDLIIPQHYTFYDFIVTKARGKSGPLFSFDVHDDIRLIADARVEKDESHAGKVLLRSWYERNKHIFPASRWEPYDPTRSYEKYTISDKKSH